MATSWLTSPVDERKGPRTVEDGGASVEGGADKRATRVDGHTGPHGMNVWCHWYWRSTAGAAVSAVASVVAD
eukprot:380739-Prymnesium_polylepis.1